MQEEYSIWADVKVKYNDEERGLTLLMNDASFNRDLSKWKFVGEHLPVESDEMSIYLPSIFRESGNYNLNDNFEIHLTANNKKLDFTIKGFIEDIYFSSMETTQVYIFP